MSAPTTFWGCPVTASGRGSEGETPVLYPNIRALREDRDLKQRQLAELLHVSQNTYSQYETGVIALTAEHLVTLADFYHVSVDYLLGRTAKPEMNE